MCINACMCMCMYACMYMFMCVFMYICMYVLCIIYDIRYYNIYRVATTVTVAVNMADMEWGSVGLCVEGILHRYGKYSIV